MPRSATPVSQPLLTVFLQIAGLAALAVAQPLLQLVKENPEFLTVHHSRAADVVVLTVLLLLIVPGVLTALVALVRTISGRAGSLCHAAVLGALTTLILLPVLDRLPVIAGWATLALALGVGIAVGLGFDRSTFIRQNLAILALVVPIVLVLFIGAAPIRAVLLPARTAAATTTGSATAPVVMIILDELPTSSLMGPDHELDCQLFPSFCRLAARSTWYRNATTISGATLRSVPAIMSGRLPRWRETPSLADHPDNIFTLLDASHRITALEAQTSLCPAELASKPIPKLPARLELLVVDLGILYQHVVTPTAWRDRLIPVADKWGNFLGRDADAADGARKLTRIDEFEAFVAAIEAGDRPSLAVAHVLLPHSPFQFLPDGRTYNRRREIPSLPDGTWGADTQVIEHSYRRHLLQVIAVDRLVGILLDRLEALGILDETAIVVTADHGIAFKPGLHRRQVREGNEADIMFVPLFLKLPGQATGEVSDRCVQTLDILPTLASALGCGTEWAFDGLDLTTTTADRTEFLFMDQDKKVERRYDLDIVRSRDEVVAWKHRLFGTTGGVDRLFSAFDPGGFLGREVADLAVQPHASLRGRILDPQDLAGVDLAGPFLPAEINGVVTGHQSDARLDLVLALDGKIVGATRSDLAGSKAGERNWQVTAPPDAFRQGANQAELFLVSEASSGVDLWQIPLFTPSYLGTDLGSARVSGIVESGLYHAHDWDGRLARWTGGRASWTVPLRAGDEPRALTIGIVSSGPKGATLSVTVNGMLLVDEDLPPGAWETQLALDGIDAERTLTIVLDSSVFVPAEVNLESSDRRELGVAVVTLVVD